jgi:hypothetical protein
LHLTTGTAGHRRKLGEAPTIAGQAGRRRRYTDWSVKDAESAQVGEKTEMGSGTDGAPRG